MAKKKTKRLSAKHSRKLKQSYSYRFLFISTLSAFVVLFVAGILYINSINNTSILGSTTYLAKGDDSGSGSSGSGSSGSDSDSDSSGSGLSGSDSSGSSEDDNSGSGSGDSDESDSSGSSEEDSSGSDSSGSSDSDTKVETRDPTTGIRTITEIKNDEVRTEVRLSEEERIKTRSKDGLTRIDLTSGGVKTRLEYKDDRVVIKAEQEDGTEVDLDDDLIFKIDERLGKSDIKIATAGAESFVIHRGSSSAITQFPLSIDLATNTLNVTTPAGDREVTFLPDQAIQNLIAANIINRVGGQRVVDETISGNIPDVSELIILGEQNGVPVYEIDGISDQKLLGFIPVSIEKTVVVSAETGEIISTDTSVGDRLLDIISF